MYSMDPDKLPKKPLTVSQASANREVDRWMRENDYHHLRDGAGLVWHLDCADQKVPDPENPSRDLWQLTVTVATAASPAQLVTTGTLSLPEDDRLLHLLGDDTIEMRMKPIQLDAASLEQAREILMNQVLVLRERFAGSLFHEIKRTLVGRHLDTTRRFGSNNPL